jgi:hypothetical protein
MPEAARQTPVATAKAYALASNRRQSPSLLLWRKDVQTTIAEPPTARFERPSTQAGSEKSPAYRRQNCFSSLNLELE